MLAVKAAIGKSFEKRGRELITDFANIHELDVVFTPSDQPAPVDGILTREGNIVAVIEARTRVTHTHNDLIALGNTYMISSKKLNEIVECGRLLGVPSFLVVRLACKTRWVWQIGSEDGQWMFSWDIGSVTNDASQIDDRQLTRDCGYLPFEKGRRWT